MICLCMQLTQLEEGDLANNGRAQLGLGEQDYMRK